MNKVLRKLFILTSLMIFQPVDAQNLDIRLLRTFNSSASLPSDNFFRWASNTDAGIVAAVPLTMGITGLIRHDQQLLRNSCVLIAATGVNTLLTNALKYSVNRDRPFVSYPDITKKSAAGSPSFPSGHTSSAFATATTLSLEYPKWYVIVPSYLWAGTVSYSRMHLGVHYPSDVLGGIIVGMGSACLTYWLSKKINRQPKPMSN